MIRLLAPTTRWAPLNFVQMSMKVRSTGIFQPLKEMWAIGYVSLYIASLLALSVFLRVTYEPTASLFQPYYFGTVLFCAINALCVFFCIALFDSQDC